MIGWKEIFEVKDPPFHSQKQLHSQMSVCLFIHLSLSSKPIKQLKIYHSPLSSLPSSTTFITTFTITSTSLKAYKGLLYQLSSLEHQQKLVVTLYISLKAGRGDKVSFYQPCYTLTYKVFSFFLSKEISQSCKLEC